MGGQNPYDPNDKRPGHFLNKGVRSPETWVLDEGGDWAHLGPDGQVTFGTPVYNAEEASAIRQKGKDAAHAADAAAGKDPLTSNEIDAQTDNAPGHLGASLGQVDARNPNYERQRLGTLLGDLGNQADTGAGAWQDMLKQGTQNAQAGASALGQSQPQVDYQSALGNIGNAQAAAQAQAGGQANILQAQSQLSGQQQLSNAYNNQGQIDLNQAASKDAAAQELKGLNAASDAQSFQNTMNTVNGIGQTAMSVAKTALSDGGEVPGKPKAFGDNEKNDTVPAWLSPGEIVIPRSVVNSPDAPGAAADFVAALQAKHGRGVQHFDGGGTAGFDPSPWVKQLANPGTHWFEDKSVQRYDKPGELQSSPFDTNRTANLANAGRLEASALGGGPSVAPQQLQNSADAGLAAAMQAQANSRGMGGAAAAGNALHAGVGAEQMGAGQAAGVKAQEQQTGQQGFLQAMLQQRAQDLAMAKAKQQAALHNAEIDAGVSLQQQAALKNIFSGLGQSAVAGSQLLGKIGGGGEDYGPDASADSKTGLNPEQSQAAGDAAFDAPADDVGAGEGAARGGRITDKAKTIPAPLISDMPMGTIPAPLVSDMPTRSELDAWHVSPNATYVPTQEVADVPMQAPLDPRLWGGTPGATVVPAVEVASVPIKDKRAKDFVAALERRPRAGT